MPVLEVLIINNITYRFKTTDILVAPRLKKLSLTGDTPAHVFSKVTSLQSLVWDTQKSDEIMTVIKNNPELEELELQRFNVPITTSSYVPPALHTLSMQSFNSDLGAWKQIEYKNLCLPSLITDNDQSWICLNQLTFLSVHDVTDTRLLDPTKGIERRIFTRCRGILRIAKHV
jgi:hypothetical protein